MRFLTRVSVIGAALLLAACGDAVTTLTSSLPSASISASPTAVASGSESTLTWSSINATSCSASGGWSGTLAASGSQSTGALTADTTYSLTCTGSGGISPAAAVTVTVNAVPIATLSADPPSVGTDGASTLTWSSTNATTCTASGGWNGTLATSGSQSTGALTADTSYSLTCTGPGGTSPAATATVTVTTSAAPTASLTANPTNVATGGASTLTWSSANATSCTASGGWSGTLATSGSQSTGALTADTSYSLTCTGPGGTSPAATATVTVTASAAPTATLTANPTSVASGGASTLTWSSTNATSCTASGGWSGALATSGSQSTGALTANKSYSLTCTGPGGTSPAATANVAIAPVPTATLTANPTSIASGGASTLTWSSTNATSCTASGGWSGALATGGTQSTGALTANTSYSLTCTGPGGTSPVAAATVTIASVPTATLTANPTSIASGGASTLTWSSTNATSCTASGAWSGALATSGSQSTGALTANTSYSLTCTGPGGTSPVAAAAVTIAPVPTATLTASPTSVASLAKSTLTWSSTDATSCTASGGWSGVLAVSGTQKTAALTATTSYSLTCTGPGGTSPTATATVTVLPIPTATLSANPTSVAPGGTSTLTWSSTNATACAASGGWSGTLATSGSQSTGAIGTTTAFSVSCSGPGGTSSYATVTVSVSSSTLVITPKIASLTLGRTQQYTATVPGGGGATWTVDGIAGGNGTVGTIDATGLYTAGTAVGTHTLVATSIADMTQSGIAVAAVTDLAGVYTYHNNPARDGTNTHEYALKPSTVNGAGFGKLASCTVDGAIYAQPLWVANLTVNGAQHNVVFVATQHDGLFAFDADASSCVKLWSVSLIDTAHGGAAGETAVPYTLVGAGLGDIQPEIGVTGTPVIDPSTNILYVVSKSINSTQTTQYQRLHAIDLATGNEKAGSPVVIAGTYAGPTSTITFDAHFELQRTGLALVNGVIYICWTAHEDYPPWYGWVMSYQYTGSALVRQAVLNVAPVNNGQSGIWMSGGAPAVDSNNNLYVLTGNGLFDVTQQSYGDSLLKIDTSLQIKDYFTPSNQLMDQQLDKDFGSGGAAVLADFPAGSTVTHALICGGKDGTVLVLNRDSLGGFAGAVVQTIPLAHADFATAAFWNSKFYISGVGGPLNAYQLSSGINPLFNLASASTHTFGFAGATPSVSSAALQNGVVWALETRAYCTGQATNNCGPVVLYAYDAANMATELWNSSLTPADKAGNAVKFTVPTIANGRVYVGTRGNSGAAAGSSIPGELDIYGLKP